LQKTRPNDTSPDHSGSYISEITAGKPRSPSSGEYLSHQHFMAQRVPEDIRAQADRDQPAETAPSPDTQEDRESRPPPLYSSVQIATHSEVEQAMQPDTKADSPPEIPENTLEEIKRILCQNIIRELEAFAANIIEYHVVKHPAALEIMVDRSIRIIFSVLFNPVACRFGREEYFRINNELTDCLGKKEQWMDHGMSIPFMIKRVKEILLSE
jgi:hypothetical protein